MLDSACALSKWNLWEKVTWCSSPREDSELMDVTLIVLTWNCQRIAHLFGGYFIAFGFSICGMHPKILQVYWVTCGMHPIIYVIYIIYIYCTYIHILYARVSLYTDIPSNDIYICIYIYIHIWNMHRGCIWIYIHNIYSYMYIKHHMNMFPYIFKHIFAIRNTFISAGVPGRRAS